MMTGLDADEVETAVEVAMAGGPASTLPAGYEIADTSRRAVRFILSTAARHRSGLASGREVSDGSDPGKRRAARRSASASMLSQAMNSVRTSPWRR